MAAIMIVLELPPRLSLSSQVSTESLYGMNTDLDFCPLVSEEHSANADITEPRVTSDLLMCAPSFNRCPVAPVALARSLPARSTRCICK